MAITALGPRADTGPRGASRPAVLWAIAVAGIAAAAGSIWLALTSEDPGEDPGSMPGSSPGPRCRTSSPG